MDGPNPKRLDRGENRFRQMAKTGLARLLIAAGVVAAVGLLLIVLYNVVFTFASVPHTYSVALGDLDGDGDLDAFYANGENEGPQPNTVLINQGGAQGGQPGEFQDSGQRLGDAFSNRVSLADLDKDGDLDAAVVIQASRGIRARVEFWLNDGQGNFSDSGQPITHFKADAFDLGDLDGDGYLDLFAGWFESGYTVWRNLGAGILFGQPGW